MSRPVLWVKDAGYGSTPSEPDAKFSPGDVVKRKSDEYVVAVAVPRGFSPEYALADLTKTPRPLMVTRGSRAITYILVRDGDPKAYLIKESDLKATDKKVDLGTVRFEGAT